MSQNNTTVIVGAVHLKTDKQQVSEKFAKRELVVDTGGTYPQLIPVTFTQDRCSLIDDIQQGQRVSIECSVRGREYNGKYYCSIEGWRVNTTAAQQPEVHQAQVVTPQHEINDDLPF